MGLWKVPGSLLMSFFLIISLALTMARVSNAQNSPEDFVRAHSAVRAEVGVPPLVWNETIAAFARKYANQLKGDCRLQHSKGPYGENLAVGTYLNGESAMKLWADEKRDYDYKSNSCAPHRVCGHYTQLVWRNSKRLGCAVVRCDNDSGTLISCNYDPPGNISGERPY